MKKRNGGYLPISKERLEYLYLEQKLNIREIAIIENMSFMTVYYRMKEHNIPRRIKGARKKQ